MLMKLNLLAARIVCALLTAFSALSLSAYSFEQGGIYYNITSSTKKTVAVTYKNDGVNSNYNDADTYAGDITLPSNVTHNGITYSVTLINTCAFQDCIGLKSISIPNAVEKIGGQAFYNCSSLVSAKLSDAITTIPRNAFLNCAKLTNIQLPANLSKIDPLAFYRCGSLTSIHIPPSVQSIGDNAFAYCTSLTDINIPEGIDIIATWTFGGCTSLKNIKIPNSVKEIGISAFSDCRGLSEIVLSDNVETIDNFAFDGCSQLKTVTIGTGIKTIGDHAFASCNQLELITVNAIEPPTAVEKPEASKTGTFDGWNYKNTDLRVPAESIEKYRTAPVWENFFKDRWPLTGIEGVEAAEGAESEVVARYDLSGRPVADDYRGMTIVRRADGSTAKEILR